MQRSNERLQQEEIVCCLQRGDTVSVWSADGLVELALVLLPSADSVPLGFSFSSIAASRVQRFVKLVLVFVLPPGP